MKLIRVVIWALAATLMIATLALAACGPPHRRTDDGVVREHRTQQSAPAPTTRPSVAATTPSGPTPTAPSFRVVVRLYRGGLYEVEGRVSAADLAFAAKCVEQHTLKNVAEGREFERLGCKS